MQNPKKDLWLDIATAVAVGLMLGYFISFTI